MRINLQDYFRGDSLMDRLCLSFFRVKTFIVVALVLFAPGMGRSQTLDELHKAALKEGGTLNFYATLAQVNAERILPVFEKRFPGLKVNHVDATSDKLVARAVTEARGGRTLADILQVPLENVSQANDQGLLLATKLPESAQYPDGMKGSFWISSDLQFFVAAWNTNLVKKGRRAEVIRRFRASPLEKPVDRRTARSGNAPGVFKI
jgi:spermidine/putrescine-binding protein